MLVMRTSFWSIWRRIKPPPHNIKQVGGFEDEMVCENCPHHGVLTAKDIAFGAYFDRWNEGHEGNWSDEPCCYTCFTNDLTDLWDFVEHMEKD